MCVRMCLPRVYIKYVYKVYIFKCEQSTGYCPTCVPYLCAKYVYISFDFMFCLILTEDLNLCVL